ncbi:MAG: TIR domain-containing protein [Anaerolineales bacterium]|nr:TIR domain-containing protein [Anaerolineales bacterium]
MENIFLSFSFRDSDRELVSQLEKLLVSHNINVVTGRRLGGGQLTDEIRSKINQSGALIALLTRRELLASGDWTTHDWVRDELNFARGANKKAIALIETDVQTGGAFGNHEHIPFDRANPMSAFLALSETVGIWKAQSGRIIKVNIMPETLAQHPGHANGQIQCQYRYMKASLGELTEWMTTTTLPEGRGAVVYLRGVQDDYLIQLQIHDGQTQWISPVSPQLVVIELNPVAGGAL